MFYSELLPMVVLVLAATILAALLFVMATRKKKYSRRASTWVITCSETKRDAIVDLIECAGSKHVVDCSCWSVAFHCSLSCEHQLLSSQSDRVLAP
jgi:hypothetical protein